MANVGKENLRLQESAELSQLHHLVDESNNESLARINGQFEVPSGDERLYFHTRPHTRGVINRVTSIAEAVHKVSPEEVSASDIEAVRFGAGKHDEIQISKPIEVTVVDSQGKDRMLIKRQRATGLNEEESAESAQQFLDKEILPKGLMTKEQAEGAIKGILLTKPGFNVELGTVIQPGFADNPFIAQAIALSDLAASGMNGAEAAVYEAVGLFWEDFMSIRRYKEGVSENDRREIRLGQLDIESFYKDQILGWLDAQVKFTKGRQKLVWGEIDSLNISEKGKNAVRELFSNENYENAIAAIKKFRNDLSSLSFEDCTKELDKVIVNVPECLK